MSTITPIDQTPDTSVRLAAKTDLERGSSALSRREWIELCAFFNMAIYDYPTDEAKMRNALSMVAGDDFKQEFKDTVKVFKDLSGCAYLFEHEIKDGLLELADDIVHYQSIADATYERLTDLIDRFDFGESIDEKLSGLLQAWHDGTEVGASEKIKERFQRALERLIGEADQRSTRANALHLKIKELETCLNRRKTEFDAQTTVLERKFGTESTEVADLKKDISDLQTSLNVLQKKDSDEVIVLSTSPLYLIIPFFGPLIMAGVDIGVGIDLAKTREKIKTKAAEIAAKQHKLGVDSRFMSYYSVGKNLTGQASDNIDNVLPLIDRLGKGWRAIKADLEFLVNNLKDEGRSQMAAEDWFNAVTTLSTARKNWQDIRNQADHYRTFGVPKRADMQEFLDQFKAA